MPSGLTQLKALPWTNVNMVTIGFSKDANVTQNDLQVIGSNNAIDPIIGFSYDPITFRATWNLSQPLSADRVQLNLSGVSSKSGDLLDGAWANGVSAFPSGSGTGTGKFQYGFNVLPGDANQDGLEISNDVVQVRNALGTTIGDTGYSIFKDVNADGLIISNDLVQVRNRLGTVLPADTTAPKITAVLANDTGLSHADGITSDPAITGTTYDDDPIVIFRAGLDNTPLANYLDISTDLNTVGGFTLSLAEMDRLAGGSLIDGSHTLHLQAIDSAGNASNSFVVPFTFDTSPPNVPTFDLAAGTADIGPYTTSATRVTLVGQADPGVSLVLVGTGLTALAANSSRSDTWCNFG